MGAPRFFRKTIKLDQLFDRNGASDGNHWVGSTFKAFAIIGTNDASFKLELVPDPTNGYVRGLPLYDGFFHNFVSIPADAVFENKVVQPGVEVEVLFSIEDELNLGTVRSQRGATTYNSEGSTAPQERIDIDGTIQEHIPANDARVVARLQYKSGTGTVYAGTPAELADPDFANICEQLDPGDDYEHWGSGAVNFKSVGGTNVYSLKQGIK
jgi:hypothetical protein